MPAHKKTADILLLSGAAAHDRGRYAGRIEGAIDDDEPIGDVMRRTMITFEEAWAEIIGMCPAGVLRRSDRLFVEQAANLHQKLRNMAVLADLEGRPWANLQTKDVKQFESLMSRLGASPADRGKVIAAKPRAKTSDFD